MTKNILRLEWYFLVLLLLGFSGSASASLVTVTFTGQITNIDPAYDGVLAFSSPINGSFTYENSSVTGIGVERVYLDANPGSGLVFNLGPYTFHETDDADFGGGFPFVNLDNGIVLGLDYFVNNAEKAGWNFGVGNDWFALLEPGNPNLLIEGQLSYMTAVPLPAAVWLFLSGCTFMLGFAGAKKR